MSGPLHLRIAGLKQETATFNPVPTDHPAFVSVDGDALLGLAGTATEIGGILDELGIVGPARAPRDLAGRKTKLVPLFAAWSVSGGPVTPEALAALEQSILDAASRTSAPRGPGAQVDDAALIVLHGAMAAADEPDPEGRLLARFQELVGDIPTVATLDLHAVLTDRMLAGADLFVPVHTYPHVDHAETGRRAVRSLEALLAGADPVTVRVRLPMLVRGDELLTDGGLFGQAIDRCIDWERSSGGLAAGVLIGNPFTDVPDLSSNVLVTADGAIPGAVDAAIERAVAIATFLWDCRDRLRAELTPLTEAIELAARAPGSPHPVIFSDAADATASGAPGDSNAVLDGLIRAAFPRRALLSLVDAPAVTRAMAAGIGAIIETPVGGTCDPTRHTPLPVSARVKALTDGTIRYEDRTVGAGGPTAVLVLSTDNHSEAPTHPSEPATVTMLVTSRPVNVVGTRVYQAAGLNPADADLVVVKSPNGFRPYFQFADTIVAVDVPGATSADLLTLPYRAVRRPIWPLDPDTDWQPGPELWRRRLRVETMHHRR